MRFSRHDDVVKRRLNLEKFPPENKILVYDVVKILQKKGVELQAEREKRYIEVKTMAFHVHDYWGMNPSSAKDHVIKEIEHGAYFTNFLFSRKSKHKRNYLHTTLRTADYLALLGYDEKKQETFFKGLQERIQGLPFAPSSLDPYIPKISKPLEYVPFEEQLRQRGLIHLLL